MQAILACFTNRPFSTNCCIVHRLEDDTAIEMTTRGSPSSPISPQQYTPPVLGTSSSYNSHSQTASAVHNPIVGPVVSSSSGAEYTAAVSSGISVSSASVSSVTVTGSGMGIGGATTVEFGQPFTMMNSFRSGGYSRLPGAEGDGAHSPGGGGRNDLSTDIRTT